MKKILILFAHPVLEKSRVHQVLTEHVKRLDGVTFNDLYQLYPDFDIDVDREQQLLADHDIIVWQHPFYWYSAPALLKQWQDLVLEHGWAYGKSGHALNGKWIFNAFTSGGGMQAYQHKGFQRCTIDELLRPFERTAQLCRMIYLPPFWIPGTHKLQKTEIPFYGEQYREVLTALRDERVSEDDIFSVSVLNDIAPTHKMIR